MNTRPPLLFALHGTQEYAARVSRHMGLELAELEERAFEDGEHKTRALTSVESRNAVIFHALYGDDERSVNDKLCRLLFFCGALKDAGARHVQWSHPISAMHARSVVPSSRTRSSPATWRRCSRPVGWIA